MTRVLLVLVCAVPLSFAASISWIDGNGNWSNAAAWNCPACSAATFPNNGNAGQTFSVSINPATPSTIALDVTSTIDSLSLGPNGQLNVAAQNGLTVAGQFSSNGGALTVGGGSQVTVNGLVSGTGAASITLTDPNTVFHAGGNMTGIATQIFNGAQLSVQGLLSQSGLLNLDGIGTSFHLGSLSQDGLSALRMSNQATGLIGGAFTNNGGTVGLQSGSQLSIGGGFLGLGNSRISLTDPNTKLQVTGDLVSGDGTAPASVQLTNGSALQVSGIFRQTGLLSADGVGTTVLTGGFSQDANSRVSLSNTALTTVNGQFVNGGVLELQSGGRLIVNGGFTGQPGARIGMTDPDTLVQISGDATGGLLQLTNSAQFQVAGAYDESGLMSLDGIGTGFSTGSYTQDSSSILQMSHIATGVVNGNFTNNGGGVNLQSGASLVVNGNYLGTGDSFAVDDFSTARVTGDFFSSGTLNLGTGSFPALTVGGNLTLGGMLQVGLPNGALPTENELFSIITFLGLDMGGSNFSSFAFPVWNGLTFAEIMGTHEVDLQVVSSSATPAPEPSALVLLLSGLGLGIVLRNRG